MKDWKKAIIREDTTLLDTIKNLEQNALKISLVIDKNDKFIGIITDGDVRRAILNSPNFSTPAKDFMNPNGIVGSPDQSTEELSKIMKDNLIQQIPIIDKNGYLSDLHTLEQMVLEEKNRANHAVIMAGGLGTRLNELTKNCPKPLLKVGPKPILETIIQNLRDYGFKNIHLCLNYKAEMIKNHFGNGSSLNVNVFYHEEEKRLGTAGALRLAKEYLPEDLPFLVMNGDILTKINFEKLLQFHFENSSEATMCLREYSVTIPYGVIETDGPNISKIIEKPTQSYFVNAGIYLLNKKSIELIPKNTFFDMPDLFDKLRNSGETTSAFPIHEYWIDIGRENDLTKARKEFDTIFDE